MEYVDAVSELNYMSQVTIWSMLCIRDSNLFIETKNKSASLGFYVDFVKSLNLKSLSEELKDLNHER